MRNTNVRKTVVLATALVAASALGQGKLTGFDAKPVGEGFQVQIKGDNLAKPKTQRVMGNRSLLLEFDANLIGNGQRQKVAKNGLSYVQSTWFNARPPKVRVHLRVEPDVQPSIVENEQGWLVSWKAAEVVSTAAKPVAKDRKNVIAAAIKATEPFPDKVPPLSIVATPTSAPATPAWAANALAERNVSLDFVNTDVVQILKALAMQASVNIVTSPEVKGSLTVSLDKVTVTEALDLVTTLAGVRYAKVGKTYVVTGSANFPGAMRQIGGTLEEGFETRVVPIYSGEGTQIKAAVLRSAYVDTAQGKIELVLPSEEVTVEKKATMSDSGGDAKKPDGEATSIATKSNKDQVKDPYVVLIGPGSKLPDIEKQVKAIDQQICRAMGISVPSSNATVRQSYHPKGTDALTLLKAVATGGVDAANPNHAKVGNVDLYATPATSISEQTIVLMGREHEVAALIENLNGLDTVVGTSGEFLIYEVKHLDPRALREELLVQVPGLTVSLPPNTVSTPNQYKPNQAKAQGSDVVSENKAGDQGAVKVDQGKGGATLTPDKGEVQGIVLPFSDFEKSATPMKLVLRGSKEQIQRALTYLAQIDVAPKQVAIDLRVMELSKEEALRVGLDWSILTGGSVELVRVTQSLGDSAGTPGTIGGSIGSGGASPSSILGTLDQISNNRNLIARPNLIGVDGRESEIFVGDIIRYIESIQSGQNGVTVTTGEVAVGVRLAVLPRIGGDGSVSLELRPVVSTLNGFTPVPGGGNLPQTSLRVAQSTMNMTSGETIAIGGLIQESDRKREGGIPILKDLPIIGRLFRRTDNSKIRSEIVLFLTAKVVDKNNRGNAADPRTHRDGDQPEPAKKKAGSDQIIK